MIPEEVRKAGETARQLTLNASNAQASEGSVIDALRAKIQEAYSQNTDLTDRLDTATGNYFSAPSEARAKYENIFNPIQREALVSKYTQQQALPMLSYSQLLGSRLGRVEDLIGGGVRGYQAQTARQSAQAQFAQNTYRDLLEQYQVEAEAKARQEAAALAREQFGYQKESDLRDYNLKLKQLAQSGSSKLSTSIIEVDGRKKLIDTQTGRVIQDLGASDSQTPTAVIEAGGRKKLINAQTGETIQDLGTTGIIDLNAQEQSSGGGFLNTLDDIIDKALGGNKLFGLNI